MLDCLTGFKWIAAVEDDFEKTGEYNYIFDLEKSYGYKVEKEVMDKDGVSALYLGASRTKVGLYLIGNKDAPFIPGVIQKAVDNNIIELNKSN